MHVIIGFEPDYIDLHMETIAMSLFPSDTVRLDSLNLAYYMRQVLVSLVILHSVSMISLLFREIKETTLGSMG